jgi:hypothetical protein
MAQANGGTAQMELDEAELKAVQPAITVDRFRFLPAASTKVNPSVACSVTPGPHTVAAVLGLDMSCAHEVRAASACGERMPHDSCRMSVSERDGR